MIRTGHLGAKSPTDAGLGKSCAMTMQKASTSMGQGKGYYPFPGPHPQNQQQQQQQNQDHEQNQGRLHRRLDTLLKNAHTVEYGALFLLFNIRRASVTKPSTGSCFQDDDGRQLD